MDTQFVLVNTLSLIKMTSNSSKVYVCFLLEAIHYAHLGTTLYSDISIRNINNALNDLFMRTNNLMADFSNAHSSILSVLYNSYLSYGVLTIINL